MEWHVERITFVLLIGVIGGFFAMDLMGSPAALLIVPLAVASPYGICSWFFGVGGFRREKGTVKGFSLKTFLMEPLVLIGMTVLAFIPVGVMGLIKQLAG